MTPEAEDLEMYMSYLSEEAYCAGWMDGLEYELWTAVVEEPRSYGSIAIGEKECARLRRFSAACAGWIVYDDTEGPKWLPLDVWEERYRSWKSDRSGLPHI
jgi:hypothetical protein